MALVWSRGKRTSASRLDVAAGDVLAAAFFVVMAAIFQQTDDELRPEALLTRVLVVLPVLLFPLRRQYPVLTISLSLVLQLGLAMLNVLAPGVLLSIIVFAYSAALVTSLRRSIAVAICATLAILLSGQILALENALDPRLMQFVVGVAFAIALGAFVRVRRQYIAALLDRAERAERMLGIEAQQRVTEERLRIARDLHDTVAHQIAVISLSAGVASAALKERPERAATALEAIGVSARTVLKEIADLLSALRSMGEEPADRPGLEQLDELMQRFDRAGMDVTCRTEGSLADVPNNVGRVAYRVLQEGLTNAHKHGADHRAHIVLTHSPGHLEATVSNPIASSADAPSELSGFGLLGLREQVASIGGSLRSGPAPGGFRLAVSLPTNLEPTS